MLWLLASGPVSDGLPASPSPATATEVELRVSSTPELVIEAETSSWALSEGKAVFSGKVTATRGSLVLRCDSLEVQHSDDGDVQLALATGNVEIQRENWKATGGRATLDQAEGSLILTESPRLEEGENSLVGERIRVFLEGERVECERCKLSIGAP